MHEQVATISSVARACMSLAHYQPGRACLDSYCIRSLNPLAHVKGKNCIPFCHSVQQEMEMER